MNINGKREIGKKRMGSQKISSGGIIGRGPLIPALSPQEREKTNQYLLPQGEG
jgi:hypothetical protein